jgi:hypothetical protein
MKKGSYISAILRADQTVFTFKDIILLWGNSDASTATVRVNYYVQKGELFRIRRGIYAKDKDYNRLELATKIFTPAYVSFETVLAKAGVIFQYYGQIFVASYQTKEIVCDGQTYSFKKLKDDILLNRTGIDNKGRYFEAGRERAFLDVLYLNKDYHFDNLSSIDWNRISEILPIYKNKRMEAAVKRYFQEAKGG